MWVWLACQLKYDDETNTIRASGKQKGKSNVYKRLAVHIEHPFKDICV